MKRPAAKAKAKGKSRSGKSGTSGWTRWKARRPAGGQVVGRDLPAAEPVEQLEAAERLQEPAEAEPLQDAPVEYPEQESDRETDRVPSARASTDSDASDWGPPGGPALPQVDGETQTAPTPVAESSAQTSPPVCLDAGVQTPNWEVDTDWKDGPWHSNRPRRWLRRSPSWSMEVEAGRAFR